jgi:hypothetical protein
MNILLFKDFREIIDMIFKERDYVGIVSFLISIGFFLASYFINFHGHLSYTRGIITIKWPILLRILGVVAFLCCSWRAVSIFGGRAEAEADITRWEAEYGKVVKRTLLKSKKRIVEVEFENGCKCQFKYAKPNL